MTGFRFVPYSLLVPGLVAMLSSSAFASVSAIWAGDGGDKVRKEELRSHQSHPSVMSRTWNGSMVKIFGARNEVLGFNLVLESLTGAADVSVSLERLVGPNGSVIGSYPIPAVAQSPREVFQWSKTNADGKEVLRNIELFYVRYLQIKGLSLLSYELYDERHIPSVLQLPKINYDEFGCAKPVEGQKWEDRPAANQHFPEIAVPMELVGKFDIPARTSQSVWFDVYVPKTAVTGTYYGTIRVKDASGTEKGIPVELKVRNFELPDVPNSKTMVYYSAENINRRYLGVAQPIPQSPKNLDERARELRDTHFQVAHRHKISLIDSNPGSDHWNLRRPREEWINRLNGVLFSPDKGYAGPGTNVGNRIYSIGTYQTWNIADQDDPREFWKFSDEWENWFQLMGENSPEIAQTERFMYLTDEPKTFREVKRWSEWMSQNPGIGRRLPSFSTVPLVPALEKAPFLNIFASWLTVQPSEPWQKASDQVLASNGTQQLWLYNGKRPSNGSFAIEDDGVALRTIPWAQYKKGIGRWYFWESTYYFDGQVSQKHTNVFEEARTFGAYDYDDTRYGHIGDRHSNGDGVLFYPGTDHVYPEESYGAPGPLVSLRLKMWRRGIQDIDYVVLAEKKNPARVRQIIERLVPSVLWEPGVSNPLDPKWTCKDISWSIRPDDWEAARAELADIIEN